MKWKCLSCWKKIIFTVKNEKDYQIFFTEPENVKIKILFKSIFIKNVIKYILTKRLYLRTSVVECEINCTFWLVAEFID
jgi:hypothetical protein